VDPYTEIDNAMRTILGVGQRRNPSNPSGLASAQGLAFNSANPAYPAIPTNPGAQTLPGGAAITGTNQAPMAFNPQPLNLEEGDTSEAAFSINKLTGTLYVKARPSKIRAVEKMLANVRGMLRKQVYIEAQIVDVQLSDNFEFGVDWSLLRGNLASGFSPTAANVSGATGALTNIDALLSGRSITIPSQNIGNLNGQSLGVGYQGGTAGVVLSALRAFGNLRVLSNPNVQVRNGSPALLSVGTSSRYVARSSSTQSTPGGGASTVTSDVQTDSVFSGVMVGVLPFIRDDGRIELLINPMQSEVDAKSLQLVSVNDTNRVTLPVVSYKGMTTTLNVGDGDVVVVGGLIDQRSSDNDRGAPGLSDVPVLGKLFSNIANTHNSRELVVVLRVRIL
jgi:MSHA type pilus biogenesis protein MshL